MMEDQKTQALLGKFGMERTTPAQFRIFLSAINHLLDLLELSKLEDLSNIDASGGGVLQNLVALTTDEKRYITANLSQGTLTIEECQVQIQGELEFSKRKQLAAYFTDDKGLEIMGEIVSESLKEKKPGREIAFGDPFMGTARTLVQAAKAIGKSKIRMILGIEPYYLSALVGYAALLDVVGGSLHKIHVIVGDAFTEGPRLLSSLATNPLRKLDIIITNPPFTRWKYLTKSARQTLVDFTKKWGYQHLISRKSMGLQIYGLLLCDLLLKSGGLLLSVLPLSTFYTIGGNAVKTLLRTKYSALGMIESNDEASFSIDSGFKEIIAVCRKESPDTFVIPPSGKSKPHKATLFTDFQANKAEIARSLFQGPQIADSNYYDLMCLPPYLDSNWLTLFIHHPLQKLIQSLLESGMEDGKIVFWRDIIAEMKLIRGFEMYGPDFFFLPNKFWHIMSKNKQSMQIKHDKGTILEIGCQYLKRALSKPSLSYKGIAPEGDIYVFDIPPRDLQSLPAGLQNYITWGMESTTPQAAINAFGTYWYSHIHECLNTKIPEGFVFIGDKFDLNFNHRASIANFSPHKIFASKNFYIVKDVDLTTSKLVAAWLNSSLFLAILILFSRKISNSWTRFLRDDYLNLPIINIAGMHPEFKQSILKSFTDLIDFKNLPPIWDQIDTPMRKALDLAILNSLCIEHPGKKLSQLYNFLSSYKAKYLT